jgi:hypothetical protein
MLPETNAIITAYTLLLLWASSSELVLAHYVGRIGPDGAHKLFNFVLLLLLVTFESSYHSSFKLTSVVLPGYLMAVHSLLVQLTNLLAFLSECSSSLLDFAFPTTVLLLGYLLHVAPNYTTVRSLLVQLVYRTEQFNFQFTLRLHSYPPPLWR